MTKSRTRFSQMSRMWHGHFGVGLIDSQAQGALVNHIGIHPLSATQPTLIGHAQYVKPRQSQFSVPHVPPCTYGNGEIFVCNIFD